MDDRLGSPVWLDRPAVASFPAAGTSSTFDIWNSAMSGAAARGGGGGGGAQLLASYY